MSKIAKKRVEANKKVESEKFHSIEEAMALVKEVNTAKFNASVDIHVRLGIDPRKADQNLRGTITLPHGTGKEKKVLVFCTPEKEQEAKDAGADYAGLDEFIQKVNSGWTDVDVIVATPNVMVQIGKLGKILGPRNLMPNPKTGTVTLNVGDAVREIKKGKMSFRVDKYGIVHTSVGRVEFTQEQLTDNTKEVFATLNKMKPSSAKGQYIKSVYAASTMSPGIKVDTKSLNK
jgi:large subunit ribosomal protein L1